MNISKVRGMQGGVLVARTCVMVPGLESLVGPEALK
jgi:hypothetical protein